MLTQLIVGLLVDAFDGRVFDRLIHRFDLAIGTGVFRFGRAMIDIVARIGEFERVRPEEFAIGNRLSDQRLF